MTEPGVFLRNSSSSFSCYALSAFCYLSF